MKDAIAALFKRRFGVNPLIVRSPGRINLIGEHTDYNEGFVLPAAIDKYIYVAISQREDSKIILFSESYQEQEEVDLQHLVHSNKGWPNYLLGVVDQLKKAGYALGGFNILIQGDVPLGAGLSSSAAVECATVFALNELFSLGIAKMDMVKMGQMAEHIFIGVKCGIMDQFASVFGRKGHAIKLDCRSLECEYVPLDLKGFKIVLFNTNVKHSLASTEYNTRREQCEQGVAWIKEIEPEVNSLRDVTRAMLMKYVQPKDAKIFDRCNFVLEENKRLLEGCGDLKRGEIEALGKKMFLSHKGLREDYEVSCKELDFLVDEVRNIPGVAGARMMGGGFGGCTINLVRESIIEDLTNTLSKKYEVEMKLPLSAYVVETAQGTEIVDGPAHPRYSSYDAVFQPN